MILYFLLSYMSFYNNHRCTPPQSQRSSPTSPTVKFPPPPPPSLSASTPIAFGSSAGASGSPPFTNHNHTSSPSSHAHLGTTITPGQTTHSHTTFNTPSSSQTLQPQPHPPHSAAASYAGAFRDASMRSSFPSTRWIPCPLRQLYITPRTSTRLPPSLFPVSHAHPHKCHTVL